MYDRGITVNDIVFCASKLQKGRSLNVLIIKKKTDGIMWHDGDVS